MAPNPNKGNQVVGSYTKSSDERRGPKDGVERTTSDMTTLEVIKKQGIMGMEEEEGAVSASIINREVKNAKGESCGMSEECSEEYIKEAEAIKLILKKESPATSSSSATSVTQNKRGPLSSAEVTVVFLQSLEPPSTTSFLDPSKAKA
ncbi:hypothetical protein K1719_025699 [Acacia pycnantha]|nr:hypothetical protein K1719_025699 [Acacia pycnantha]